MWETTLRVLFHTIEIPLMRGHEDRQTVMFQYVTMNVEQYVPLDHPLRRIRVLVDEALSRLDRTFSRMYATMGRPSIPPEYLLRARILQALYTIRSERQLVEQIHYNLLFRWFVGLDLEAKAWDSTVFTHNEERFLSSDMATRFLHQILAIAEDQELLSKDHFTVDGTLLAAAASIKSFVRKDGKNPPADSGNDGVDFHGKKLKNKTHRSTTDPDARLTRKGNGQSAFLAFAAHLLMENRTGLIVDTCVTKATGKAERQAAKRMMKRVMKRRGRKRRATLGGDKGYDVREFTKALRAMNVTPHVASKERGTSIDARTRRHAGYAISLRIRKMVEEAFGWVKDISGQRKLKHRGRRRVNMHFTFSICAYDLLRIANLQPAN